MNRSVARREALAKTTGAAIYTADLEIPGALWGVTVRSECARGRIAGFDFDPAFPWGECTVVTPADIPGDNCVAHIVEDQPCLAATEINHWGEPLLLIAHPGRYMAEAARSAVRAHLTNFASVAQASWAVSGMWAAVIVARAALAWLASRVSGEFIVVGSAVLTGAGTLWLLFAAQFLPAAAALALTGAAMAGIFPTTMGMAGVRFAGRPGAVFGVMLAVARTGAMLMPWLAGSLAERSSTSAAIGVALASAGGILFLALRLHRIPPAPEC